ncbi:magnesium/cobalt transporter CorA [Azoarcus sp. L1K30]|uniref:magnesium/cobalt transporter CorA n=1 Tax=Azoarcus sp. L1K30 TaxID=2820277 RepID=UPI001B83604F|nr:magnesium/cobalt transporter CorA [Azoarcus sp. L1K30]MBR0565256.1 magnesium/cobalt transporter CorA [Azoarcus sp. L1K30]
MLINCIAYQNGRKLADLPIAEIADYLQRPDCFVWVALKDASPEEMAQMKAAFGLHELAVEDANHGHQRPKVEEYGEEVFAVMHLVEEREGKLLVGEVHTFVGRNYILSVRNHNDQNFLGVRARCEREPKMLAKGSGYVFYALMDAVVDRYFPLIEKLETELEAMEERIFTKGAARSNIRRLYRLKRKITVLKHAVTPLMEAAGKLHSGRVPEVCANSRHYFRDVFDHLTRINASLDSIRDTIGTAIQVNLSMVTIDQTEVSKRLAAWAGIFAVATALAGIWGMNFTHMPELQWTYGYPAALAVIFIASAILYWQFKRARWL